MCSIQDTSDTGLTLLPLQFFEQLTVVSLAFLDMNSGQQAWQKHEDQISVSTVTQHLSETTEANIPPSLNNMPTMPQVLDAVEALRHYPKHG